MNNLDHWLEDMISKGLASTASSWIEQAVEQKNPGLTVSLANSVLLKYTEWDKVLFQLQTLN